MAIDDIEYLPYKGELPQDANSFKHYLQDLKRGKSLSQLKAAANFITPEIKQSWSPRSFTAVSTPEGNFDATICTISYHFNKHSGSFRSVKDMTEAARKYFQQNKQKALPNGSGLLKFPDGSLYEADGRIVTFVKG